MKALLLSFVLGLLAAMQAQAIPTVDEDQDVTGIWYLKATASDKKIPYMKLGSVSVMPMTIKALEGGNLQVKFTFLIAGRCQEMSTVLEKTDQPDKYTLYGGKQVLHIIPSEVEGHSILYYEGSIHGHRLQMAKLVGRDPDLNQEALEDFQNAVRARGLNAENIFIPTQRETCPLGSN